MELKVWFILSNEKIVGPFKQSDIINELNEGKWIDSRFWSKGKPHWMTSSQFKDDFVIQKKQNESQTSGTLLWYIKDHETLHGPVSYDEMLIYLRKKPNYKMTFVSNSSAQDWQGVYQFQSLMDNLGVNRRHHPRVPIEGTITILEGFFKGKKIPLITLSQGGLGAVELRSVSIGEKIKGVFSGANLSTPIHFQGEIVFLNPEGGIGLKFTNISAEGLSQIIAYVKQFVESHPDTDFLKIA